MLEQISKTPESEVFLRPASAECMDCGMKFEVTVARVVFKPQLNKRIVLGPLADVLTNHHLATGSSNGVFKGDGTAHITFKDSGEELDVEVTRYKGVTVK